MKSVHRRRAIEAEDDDDEEGFEQQLQKKMAAQRVAAAGKRPRSLAADTPADDDDDEDDEDAVFHDEYVYSVQDDPGLYKDVADYNRMQALSEFDREMELAERMDMRQKNMDQWERRREIAMEKRRAQRVAAEASAKKEKGAARAASRAGEAAAAAAEADAAPNIPDARQQLLAEMKEAREKRQAQIEEGDGPKGRRRKAAAADDAAQAEPRRPPAAAAAEEEEAEEGAVEDDEPARAAKARERAGRRSRLEEAGAAAGAEGGVEALGSLEPGEEPAPYEQLERIRLTRNRLESWIEEPFFEETVVGCFVRVSIGQDSGEPIYRVAEVVGVTEGSLPYTLSGGKAQTKKRLLLEIAGSRRAFHVTFVSNSDFGVDELRKYRRLLEERLLPRRTVRQIEAKVAQLLRAKHYVYNEQDVSAMVQKNLEQKKVVGRSALRRAELLALREAAVERAQAEGGQDGAAAAEIERLDGLLAQLDAIAQEGRRALDSTAAPPSASVGSISAINQRNRKLERQGAASFTNRKEEVADDVNNPFARRETRPSMYWHKSAPAKKEGDDARPTGGPPRLTVRTDGAEEGAAPIASGGGATAATALDGGEEPSTPAFKQLMRQHTADDLSADLAAARGDDGEALPALVAAHMVRLDFELLEPKEAKLAAANAAAQRTGPPGGALLGAAAVRSYAEWLSVSHQPVSAATKRMSLHDYIKRRDGPQAMS